MERRKFDYWNSSEPDIDRKYLTGSGLVLRQSVARFSEKNAAQKRKSAKHESLRAKKKRHFDEGQENERGKEANRMREGIAKSGHSRSHASMGELLPDASALSLWSHGMKNTTYKVTVVTGSLPDAGTSAAVYLQMKNRAGEKGLKKRLVDKHKVDKHNRMMFPPGSALAFRLPSRTLGEIHSIRIEIDQAFDHESWYCEKIKVKDKGSGQEWVFPCDQWLDFSRGDAETARVLLPQEPEELEMSTYQITTVSGISEESRFLVGDVFITLYSSDSDTGQLLLARNGEGCFQPGSTDVFRVDGVMLEEVIKVRVEIASGSQQSWYLERLVIKNRKVLYTPYFAACSDWVISSSPVDLLTSTDPMGCPRRSRLQLTFFTGEKTGSGTTANVYVTFVGSNGRSSETFLENDGKNFSDGMIEECTIDTEFVGSLQQMKVSHDGRGARPEWFLSKVIVDSLANPKRVFEFICNRWLSRDRDDGKTSRVLTATGLEDVIGSDEMDGGQPSEHVYDVMLEISEDQSTRKPAQSLSLVLYGEEPSPDGQGGYVQVNSGKLQIKDDFALKVNRCLEHKLHTTVPSPLTQLGVGIEDRTKECLLSKVVLYCMTTMIEQTFISSKWLSDTRDGQLTERVLFERTELRRIRKPKIVWRGLIYSKSKSDAFPGNISINIYGAGGSSGDLFVAGIDSEKAAFSVKSEDIGQIFKMRISLPESAADKSDWVVKQIVLSNDNEKHDYTFNFKKTLNPTKEPFYSTVAETAAESPNIEKPPPKMTYKIRTFTSSKKGGGTSANVSLGLVGKDSDSGYRRLYPSNPEDRLWMPASVDHFTFECVQLGPLHHISVGHDGGENEESDWLLDKVEVEPLHPGGESEVITFPCGRWISARLEDCMTKIDLFAEGSGQKGVLGNQYDVSVTTGDVEGGGGVKSGHITLIGSKAQSRKLLLKSAADFDKKFQQGTESKFTFQTVEFGELRQILIGHEEEEGSWYLERVVVKNDRRGEKVIFNPQRWLSKEEGDGQLEALLDPQEIFYKRPLAQYQIEVTTGKDGTQGEVHMTVYGNEGNTSSFRLHKSSSDFEANAKTTFTVENADVGEVNKVRVQFYPAGKEFWELERIMVHRSKPEKVERSSEAFWASKNTQLKHGYRKVPEETFDRKIPLSYNFKCDKAFSPTNQMKYPIWEFSPCDEKDRIAKKDAVKTLNMDIFSGHGTSITSAEGVFFKVVGSKSDTGFREMRNIATQGKSVAIELETVNLGSVERILFKTEKSLQFILDKLEIKSHKKELFIPAQKTFDCSKLNGQITHTVLPMNRNLIENNLPSTANQKNPFSYWDHFGLEMLRGKVFYQIKVTTGSKVGSGTDSKVYAYLHGLYEDSEKIYLSQSLTNSSPFQAGQTDEFCFETTEVGELRKFSIGLEGSGWFLEKVEVTLAQKGQKWLFPCSKWLSKTEGDCLTERSLKVFHQMTETIPRHRFYEIKVKTSKKGQASTNANVFIQLYGEGQKSSELSLVPRANLRQNHFNEGKEDVFLRELENVGENLHKIRIGHDNSGSAPGWHLESVQVRFLIGEYESIVHQFPCAKWMARDEGDRAIERELAPSEVYRLKYDAMGKPERTLIEHKQEDTVRYTVHVYTGDVSGAGTDANVFMTLYGEQGDSGERALKHSDTNINKFEQRDQDTFNIEAVNLGPLYKCRIRHDNKGMIGAAWFLDRIEVVSEDGVRTTFHCERWLSKRDDDKKIERTLYAKGYNPPAERPAGAGPGAGAGGHPVTSYIVRVTTGHDDDMGTDANAFINIFGSNGNTGKLQLAHVDQAKFKPSSSEEFHLMGRDVGNIRRVDVSHDGLMSHQAWFVETIEIDLPRAGKNYIFKLRNWLAQNKGTGKLEKTLTAVDSETTYYQQKTAYEIQVYTGDEFQAGTDLLVEITISGDHGTSNPLKIPKNEMRFERGGVDYVHMDLEDIGSFRKLRVKVLPNGFRKRWFLDKFVIKNLTSGESAIFNYNNWLGMDKTNVEIPAEVHNRKVIDKTSYEISVTTSDVRGSSTDANVSCILFGENGDSGQLDLKSSNTHFDKFERGNTDVFEFTDILDLGNILKIRIWHDNSGLGSSWHLSHVLVRNTASGKEFKFSVNKWLSKSEDDKQISREVQVDGFQSFVSKTDSSNYKVIFEAAKSSPTEKLSGLITFTMKSNNRLSSDVNLDLSKEEFKDSKLEYNFKETNFSTISGVFVNYTKSSSKEPSLFLDKIQVFNLQTRENYTFTGIGELPQPASPEKPVFVKSGQTESGSRRMSRNLQQISYELKVVTGNKMGAGTDSNVFVTIFGGNGDSGKLKLADSKTNINKFETGQTDIFNLTLLDLGKLQKLKIEHDNSGPGPAWFLDRVEINNKTTNEHYVFPCDKWFDKGKGDKLICRDLYPRQQFQK